MGESSVFYSLRELSHKIQEPVKDSRGATRACAQYFSPLFKVDMKRLCYSHVAAVQLIVPRVAAGCLYIGRAPSTALVVLRSSTVNMCAHLGPALHSPVCKVKVLLKEWYFPEVYKHFMGVSLDVYRSSPGSLDFSSRDAERRRVFWFPLFWHIVCTLFVFAILYECMWVCVDKLQPQIVHVHALPVAWDYFCLPFSALLFHMKYFL